MHRLAFLLMICVLGFAVSGCADVYSIPSVAVSSDGHWAAFLSSEEFASRLSLKAVNLTDGTLVNIGAEGHQQGAFAWHPSQQQIAYFNLSDNGVPSIRITDMSDPGTGIDQFGALAFPGAFWVNQMSFSPQGNQLAMAVILLPFDAVIDPNHAFTREQISGGLYLGDLGTGQANIVSPAGVFPTTAVWSPDGTKIAYMAWADDNQDGIIDIVVDSPQGINSNGDHYRVFIYDTASGQNMPVNDPNWHSSPSWLDANTLIMIASSPDDLAANNIVQYDVATQTASVIRHSDNIHTVMGVTVSPDSTQIAFSMVDQQATGIAVPSSVNVISVDGSDERQVYVADGEKGLVDVPIWTKTGSHLLISTANPPSAQLTAFAEYNEDIPSQQLVQVNLESGEEVVLYEGTMSSTGLLQFNLQE